eukprot:jgi/Botrbrau1/5201/Bobra.0172s0069.1
MWQEDVSSARGICSAASCVGEVLGWHKGLVRVAWANGSTSAVPPDQLFVLNAADDEHGDLGPPYDDFYEDVSRSTSNMKSTSSIGESRSGSFDLRELFDGDQETDSKDTVLQYQEGGSAQQSEEATVATTAMAAGVEHEQTKDPEGPLQALELPTDNQASCQSGEAGTESLPDVSQQRGSLANALDWATGGVNNIVDLIGAAASHDAFVQEALDQEPVPSYAESKQTGDAMAQTPSEMEPQAEPAKRALGPEANSSENHCLEDEPHFRTLEEAPADHHFVSNVGGRPLGKRFQKAVLKEWAMLQAGLPPSIWVAVFEGRCVA